MLNVLNDCSACGEVLRSCGILKAIISKLDLVVGELNGLTDDRGTYILVPWLQLAGININMHSGQVALKKMDLRAFEFVTKTSSSILRYIGCLGPD